MPNIPASRPRLTTAELETRIQPFTINRTKYPVLVVGIRGYYRDTMGVRGRNDRGIYDDALFVVSPSVTAAYNGNTDPSSYRQGRGSAEATKGIASLNPGAWFVHKFARHKNEYEALCQRAGPVTVTRDGTPPYEDTGNFGINIHRGGLTKTSSLGCQTIHPSQWDSFIALVRDHAQRYHGAAWRAAVIPYVLLVDSV